MATKRIKMKKLRELYRLKFELKLSHRCIGRALNISPGTVSYYTQAVDSLGLDWLKIKPLDDDKLTELITPLAKQLRHNTHKKQIPDYQYIHDTLSQKHMTLMLLWEEYVQATPEPHYSYAQYTRLYKKWAKKQKLTFRIKHNAGEKVYVDYAGSTIPICCRNTGKILFKAQIFIMALGLSQYTFAFASRSQKKADWINAHVRAFQFFGGTPEVVVPDNLKSGVTDSCQFEPEINPSYADMAEHYELAILPARPRKPQDKSIAENAVLVSSRWILARLSKQTFYSLNALNNAIAELLIALNNKPFQKREGSRAEQFALYDKPALKSLPTTPYQFAELCYKTIGPDYHIKLLGHHYSVPSQYAYEQVLCRYTTTTIEVFVGSQRIASHPRSYECDGRSTDTSHMPKAHRMYHEWTPQVFLDWAQETGVGVFNVAQEIIIEKKHPEQCSKIHFGLKRLCKRFGKHRLNQACRRAIALQCVRYKSIESILSRRLDEKPHIEELTVNTNSSHQNLLGSAYYQQ